MSERDMGLSAADRALIEALEFDPAAEAAFNVISATLVWSDEVPSGLTPDGAEYLRDLIGARGFIHRGVPTEDWQRGWTDVLDHWTEALTTGLHWPGFRRIALSRADRELLARHLGDTELP